VQRERPAASAIAVALGAAKLVMLTDVPGVLVNGRSPTRCQADDLWISAAGGGMGPKLLAAADAVRPSRAPIDGASALAGPQPPEDQDHGRPRRRPS
jgi:acetylglutamate kinase